MNLAHTVLWVEGAETSLKFYENILALEPVRE